MINRAYLRAALDGIEGPDNQPYMGGQYGLLLSQCIVPTTTRPLPPSTRRALYGVGEDLWDALTVITRVEFQRDIARKGILDEMRWMYFLGADVRELHITLRSFYDGLCLLLEPFVDRVGQVPLRSFNDLRRRLANPAMVRRLGAAFAAEITAADWFDYLRDVRDGLVHRGLRPLVFPQLDRIGFQVHSRNLDGLRVEGLMINENIVDFESYTAVQIGQAMGLLQRLCEIILTRLPREEESDHARNYHPALVALRAWISRLNP